MSDYTADEREAAGLTNEKLFSSAGSMHWGVIAGGLRDHLTPDLREEVEDLAASYFEASVPYAYDAIDENLEQERALLPRVRAAIGDSAISEEVRRSLEFLEAHANMWDNGEAANLVANKMERENDVLKRMALRARKDDEPSRAAGQEDPE